MANIQFIDVINSRRSVKSELIIEAFTTKSLHAAVESIKNVLQRQLGVVLYPYEGVDQFICKYGTFFGAKFFIGTTTQAIRFNFERSGSSNEVVSVDVWDATSGKFPVANIPTQGVSIVKIIPVIVDAIRNPHAAIGKTVEPSALSESVEVAGHEYATKADAIKDLLTKGYPAKEIANLTGAAVSQIYGIRSKLASTDSNPDKQYAKIRPGTEEQSADPEVEQGNKTLAGTQYADPETIFDDLQDLLDLVISGAQPSLLVTGMAGIGKTASVLQALSKHKSQDEFKIIKGFSTPFGLYQTLFQNRTKMVVFDDCDSVFRDPNARNILKAALDSYDKRTVSWPSRNTFSPEGMTPEEIDAKVDEDEKLPNEFDFEGQVVFISNLRKDQIEPAILSRTMAIDITLRAKDVFLRMETILSKLDPKVKEIYKKDALEHLKQNHDKLGKQVNIRTLINAGRMRAGGSPNWKRLVERYS